MAVTADLVLSPAPERESAEARPQRPCGYCGTLFTPTCDNHLYCKRSHNTKAQAQRKREREGVAEPAPPTTAPQRPCGYCGAPFTPIGENHVFCTPEHRKKADARRKAEQDAKAEPKGPRPPRPCEYCGTLFTPTSDTHAFCRRSHRNKANTRRKAEREALTELARGPICPHPYKKSYSSREQASLAEWEASNPDLRLYRCPCGALHYGHPKRKSVKRKQTRQEAA